MKFITVTALTIGSIVMATSVFAQGPRNGHCNGPDVTFESLDLNGDGGITLEELASKASDRFAQADTDNDGLLSQDEIIAAGQARMQARHGNNADRPEHANERAQHMIERLMNRKDTNNDGMLSLEEMKPGNADERFARQDGDSDGAISPEEWNTAKESHRGGCGNRRHNG